MLCVLIELWIIFTFKSIKHVLLNFICKHTSMLTLGHSDKGVLFVLYAFWMQGYAAKLCTLLPSCTSTGILDKLVWTHTYYSHYKRYQFANHSKQMGFVQYTTYWSINFMVSLQKVGARLKAEWSRISSAIDGFCCMEYY